MKVGIISFAHMHAYSYAEEVTRLSHTELVGVYDEDEERGRKAAATFGTAFFDSYYDLLQDVDAVIVTSENAKHEEHVVAAAQAKKHILCEKPLSTSIQSAEKMIAACEENQVFLQIAFPVRFNTSVQRAKQLVDEGKIGRILAMRGTNRGTNPGGWFVDRNLSGGGAVIDHTVHVVDIMRWFTGSEISEVYAEVDQLFSDVEIDDAGVLTFEFKNGVFATLDCSWSRNIAFPTWGDVTLEVIGTNGTLSVDAFGQNVHVYADDHGYKRNFWGDSADGELVNDFVTNVIENKQPTVTGFDGLKAVEVAIAAYESSDKHEPVLIKSNN